METRTEYIERLSAQIVAWDVQIDQLRDAALGTPHGAENDSSHVISELRLKRDEVAKKLQGISSANDDEWEELKSGTERVWGEVRGILYDTIVNVT
ncbi:MAG: hypothetical protein PHI31_15130 [Desulfuromonadaceae bacterium]|nr:hypothetical protein [Desulfuromonadaceae bacterium]